MKSTTSLARFSTMCIITAWAILSIVVSPVCGEELKVKNINLNEPYQITARIMAVDLSKRFIVVAENNIHLQYIENKKTKVITWITTFVDKQGQPIAPERFKIKDKVTIFGSQNSTGKITADKIILLAPGQKSQTTNGSDTIKKVDGVWIN